MHIKTGELVTPGDKLGAHEEWMPGDGTYERNGFVFAKVFGRVRFDEDKLEAVVDAVNPVSTVKEGDVIYGTITDRRGALATMDITLIEGKSRTVRTYKEGTIHISKISNDYTENIEDMYLKGDIVRAKIIQVEPSIQLTTMGKSFGVVRGYCFNCRRGMGLQGNTLYCEWCERRERRKLSTLYGKIKLKDK